MNFEHSFWRKWNKKLQNCWRKLVRGTMGAYLLMGKLVQEKLTQWKAQKMNLAWWKGFFFFWMEFSDKFWEFYGFFKKIVKRLGKDLFNTLASRKNNEFVIRASYLEIYLEHLDDLMAKYSKIQSDTLKIREDPVKGVFVQNLVKFPINSENDLAEIIENGTKFRKTGSIFRKFLFLSFFSNFWIFLLVSTKQKVKLWWMLFLLVRTLFWHCTFTKKIKMMNFQKNNPNYI